MAEAMALGSDIKLYVDDLSSAQLDDLFRLADTL
jgi:hypothetical protein